MMKKSRLFSAALEKYTSRLKHLISHRGYLVGTSTTRGYLSVFILTDGFRALNILCASSPTQRYRFDFNFFSASIRFFPLTSPGSAAILLSTPPSMSAAPACARPRTTVCSVDFPLLFFQLAAPCGRPKTFDNKTLN